MDDGATPVKVLPSVPFCLSLNKSKHSRVAKLGRS